VVCGGVEGMVTAIFIRGKGRTYEFSYTTTEGDPKSVTAEEFELKPVKPNQIGFRNPVTIGKE